MRPSVERHDAALSPALQPEPEHQAQLCRFRVGLLPKAAVRLNSFFGQANLSHPLSYPSER